MSLVSRYEQFILSNAETVGYMETLLQAGYNFTPSRFGDNEVTTEGVYSGISLLSLYHDVILWRQQRKEIKEQVAALEHHQRKLVPSWWRLCAILLSALSGCAVFAELYGKSKGKKWKFILLIETLRSLVRFLMLFKSGGAMLIRQQVPARAVNPTGLEPQNDFRAPEPQALRETMMDYARFNKKDPWTSFWAAQSPDTPRCVVYIPTYPNAKRTMGEVLYILRPLVYAICLMKYGRKSWSPWVLSLLIDYFSNKLSVSQKKLNLDESDELSRRKLLWFLYLIRSPFYETVLCTVAHKLFPSCIAKRTQTLSNGLARMIKGYRDVYFYTSGSS